MGYYCKIIITQFSTYEYLKLFKSKGYSKALFYIKMLYNFLSGSMYKNRSFER